MNVYHVLRTNMDYNTALEIDYKYLNMFAGSRLVMGTVVILPDIHFLITADYVFSN